MFPVKMEELSEDDRVGLLQQELDACKAQLNQERDNNKRLKYHAKIASNWYHSLKRDVRYLKDKVAKKKIEISKLEKEVSDLKSVLVKSDRLVCIVCYEEVATWAYTTCGHLCIGDSCIKEIKRDPNSAKCYICRKPANNLSGDWCRICNL